jgi:hypothetical protein
MGLHQIKGLLPSKGNNCQSEKAVNRMGENLYSYSSNRGLISKIYKELKKCNTKRTSNPINKYANELNTFSEDTNDQ